MMLFALILAALFSLVTCAPLVIGGNGSSGTEGLNGEL